MNTFANSLFSVLFGWARGLIQRVWNDAASGQLSGFLTWLGDHWLWVALGLAVGCTVMDYLIWLIRWRPYLLWRSFFRRFSRLLHREKRKDRERFEQGYQSSVDLTVNPEPRQAREAEEAWQEEAWSAPPPEEEPPAPEPVFFTPVEKDPRPRQFTPPQDYEAPPMRAAALPVAGSFTAAPAPRRRRSERHERRQWRDWLLNDDEAQYAMLDGLPPRVDRQQAFHEPVYPRQRKAEDDEFAAWQRPNDRDVNG